VPNTQQRAARYRKRAEEIRSAAEEMKSAESRRTLAKLARDYDVLADRIEGAGVPDGAKRKKPT